MLDPSPKLRLTVAFLYGGIPVGHALYDPGHAKKLPASIGVYALTAATTGGDTGAIGQEALRPVAKMTVGGLIRLPQPGKPGMFQLPGLKGPLRNRQRDRYGLSRLGTRPESG